MNNKQEQVWNLEFSLQENPVFRILPGFWIYEI